MFPWHSGGPSQGPTQTDVRIAAPPKGLSHERPTASPGVPAQLAAIRSRDAPLTVVARNWFWLVSTTNARVQGCVEVPGLRDQVRPAVTGVLFKTSITSCVEG